jgi:hypothetical protein
MVLMIELSPDLERRLTEEAARRGQSTDLLARAILEERLAPPQQIERTGERTPEQILADFFARCPPAAPEELAVLARQQGVQPVPDSQHLLGEGPTDGDEFDVDAFLAARKQWQSEGRPPGIGLVDPEDAHR